MAYAADSKSAAPRGLEGSTPSSGTVLETRITAEWTFQPRNVCEELAAAIEHDLAYAAAYQDPATRRQPPNRYSCYVDRLAHYKLYGRWPDLRCDQDLKKGAVAPGVGNEIGVNKECTLVHEQSYRDKARRSCTLDEVVDGVLAHENVHVEQCKRQPELYRSEDTEYWGDTEVRAHLAGVARMLEAMRRRCPQYHIGELENRYREIDAKRLRH